MLQLPGPDSNLFEAMLLVTRVLIIYSFIALVDTHWVHLFYIMYPMNPKLTKLSYLGRPPYEGRREILKLLPTRCSMKHVQPCSHQSTERSSWRPRVQIFWVGRNEIVRCRTATGRHTLIECLLFETYEEKRNILKPQ